MSEGTNTGTASRRVVITGLGAISALGVGADTLWQGLLEGRSGIAPIESFDASKHASQIAGEATDFDITNWIDKKEASRMDRYIHLAIAAADEAVKDAGYNLAEPPDETFGGKVLEGVDPIRAGCFVGSGIGGLHTLEEQYTRLSKKGPKRVSAFTIPKMISDTAPGSIATMFGLRGPNAGVVTACASGAHSIGEAFEIIKRNDADVMVAGGTEASVTPLSVAGFSALKALSTRNDDPQGASRPFDKDRDGFVMAEGAGIVVLEELEAAKARGARIYAELVGYGATADAFHMTQPCPDGNGATRALQLAMSKGGLTPEDIDYINAHGTSTHFNDKIETLAIKNALGEKRAAEVAISSTKSMIGHALGAAAAVAIVAVAKTIFEGKIHPTINYTTPDPECDLDYVPNVAREANVRGALLNSLGFGGHNAALALRKY